MIMTFDKEQAPNDPYALYVNPVDMTEYRIIRASKDRWTVAIKDMGPFKDNDDENATYSYRNMDKNDITDVAFLLACKREWSDIYGH